MGLQTPPEAHPMNAATVNAVEEIRARLATDHAAAFKAISALATECRARGDADDEGYCLEQSLRSVFLGKLFDEGIHVCLRLLTLAPRRSYIHHLARFYDE